MAARPPVSINGQAIPLRLIAEEAQHHPARTPAAAFQHAARAVVIRVLLLQEAERLGIAAVPELVATGKREVPEEARIRALIELKVPATEPTEDQCRAFYMQNAPRFRSGDLFEASHILFAADPDDGNALTAAVARAEETIAELAATPHVFEALARERSDCDSRANGGRLGQFSKGETVPEFETALYALEPGEIAPKPIKSRFGVHVLRLDARVLGQTLPFDYVSGRIAAFLAEQAWRKNVARYIDDLVSPASIEGVDMRPARRAAA